MDDNRSLFQRIGGEAAVLAAVEPFYRKVMDDPLTRPFFESLDMAAQVKKQTAFLAWAFDGPVRYKGRDLRAAHLELVARGLGDAHFDAVLGHLSAALDETGVAPALIEEAVGIIAGTRSQVLNR